MPQLALYFLRNYLGILITSLDANVSHRRVLSDGNVHRTCIDSSTVQNNYNEYIQRVDFLSKQGRRFERLQVSRLPVILLIALSRERIPRNARKRAVDCYIDCYNHCHCHATCQTANISIIAYTRAAKIASSGAAVRCSRCSSSNRTLMYSAYNDEALFVASSSLERAVAEYNARSNFHGRKETFYFFFFFLLPLLSQRILCSSGFSHISRN